MNTHLKQTIARLSIITAFACLLASCSACVISTAGAQTMNSNMVITNANVTNTTTNIDGSMQSSRTKVEEPKSTVYGRAIYDDTGRPVKRARVLLLNTDGSGPERSGLTNASGEFRIKAVPAGRYFTAVDAAGIVSPVSLLDVRSLKTNNLDLSVVREQFEEIDVDGKKDNEITVRAKRGAAIGGRVTYADGDPAINVPITVMRRSDDSKSLTQIIVGLSQGSMVGMKTDDRGMFRVAGLPPGEYLVAVTEIVEHTQGVGRRYGGIDSLVMSDAQMLTFYHSATRAKGATPIRVEAGEDRGDVDITIAERGLHTLSGVVRGGRDGRPVADASVSFMPKETDSSSDNNNVSLLADESPGKTQTDQQGRWQLNELPDGVYTISVNPPREYLTEAMLADRTATSVAMETSARPAARPKKSYAPKQQEVKIAGGDVMDVTIVLAVGGRISGTYVYESQQKIAHYEYASFYVEAGDGKKLAAGGGPEGKFTIDSVPPGKMYLREETYNSEGEKLYVKSMTWHGRDLLREPLEIAEGTEIEGVQVVLASDMATLHLRALAASDKRALRGAVVLLVPADPAQRSRLDSQASCTSDGDGACSVSRAPGEYLIIALTPGALVKSLETVIRERALNATHVTLRAGEHKSLEVVVSDGK